MASPRTRLPQTMATPQRWAQHLYGHARWCDARLGPRVCCVAATVAARPGDTIPQRSETWGAAKATYRLLANERIGHDDLIGPVAEATARQCSRLPAVLAIQDTTTLSYSTATQTEDLGPINDTAARGMFAHSVLATRLDGMPLGLLAQHIWCRDPKRRGVAKQRRQRPFEDKESARWVEGIRAGRAAMAVLAGNRRPRLIHVFDREGDIHEVFEAITDAGEGAVIRSAHSRRTHGPDGQIQGAHERVHRGRVVGTTVIDVPRKPGQRARKARVELRACRVHLAPSEAKHPQRRAVDLNLVEVFEPAPPASGKRIHWLLWTSEPIGTRRQVLEVVEIYRKRWKIEEVHLALKSGCGIEDLRLKSSERLAKAVALYTAVAVRIVALRDAGRLEPDIPCTALLSDAEWRALWTRFHGKPPSARARPPTVGQTVKWIGQLGGHLGRKGDGMPGVRTLWRGLRDLSLLVEMYVAARR